MAKRKRNATASNSESAPVKKTKGSASERSSSKPVESIQTTKSKSSASEKSRKPAESTLVKKTKTSSSEKKAKPAAPSFGGGITKLETETLQIIAGSYDHVLHGLTARITEGGDKIEFADTFLFNAHSSAIRCVAVSPPTAPAPGQMQKVLLASGSTDERINIYSLSAHPPSGKNQNLLAKVASRPILENSKNRELGTLLHHTATVTALRFPTRSKLLTGSEDSTISVARTRDWSVLSTIKVPVPVAQGRPSGDTAPFGGTPSGVNDFAIHPSMKLMISVGKGERCMRLWNLVTGKKAGVLSFSKDMLQQAGEGRHSTGEGRKVVWGSADGADEFAVGFDRDVVVFGMDSVPKCRVMGGERRIKVHQFTYITIDEDAGVSILAVATEDGRVVFFSTRTEHLTPPEESDKKESAKTDAIPIAKMVGFVGGPSDNIAGRIKDILVLPSTANSGVLYLVGAGSEGSIRVWALSTKDLVAAVSSGDSAAASESEKPMGRLLGSCETQNRITCLAGYLMLSRPDGVEESEDEFGDEDDEDEDDDGDDSEDE
ncbi:hypothetical protein E4U57_001610 [Claviceps arundinis]|uniref:MAK11 protein (Maintenance of killer toxin-encoding satellite M1 dsRNA) n=1 Tax=Claviceps arundinis TaxID=1623583 RepID=A0A9P7MSK4_9HYPO|nr:hypothetical protein E4U56_001574 [Claviceps arundinis]KAG5966907.1 hypothetical protein E4U57_001610 [Claviceps arundinis]